jgi:hypothetical protein
LQLKAVAGTALQLLQAIHTEKFWREVKKAGVFRAFSQARESIRATTA